MRRELLNELANLFRVEADGLADSYAWPPRAPLSAEELAEVQRLDTTAARIRYRAVST